MIELPVKCAVFIKKSHNTVGVGGYPNPYIEETIKGGQAKHMNRGGMNEMRKHGGGGANKSHKQNLWRPLRGCITHLPQHNTFKMATHNVLYNELPKESLQNNYHKKGRQSTIFLRVG